MLKSWDGTLARINWTWFGFVLFLFLVLFLLEKALLGWNFPSDKVWNRLVMHFKYLRLEVQDGVRKLW